MSRDPDVLDKLERHTTLDDNNNTIKKKIYYGWRSGYLYRNSYNSIIFYHFQFFILTINFLFF